LSFWLYIPEIECFVCWFWTLAIICLDNLCQLCKKTPESPLWAQKNMGGKNPQKYPSMHFTIVRRTSRNVSFSLPETAGVIQGVDWLICPVKRVDDVMKRYRNYELAVRIHNSRNIQGLKMYRSREGRNTDGTQQMDT